LKFSKLLFKFLLLRAAINCSLMHGKMYGYSILQRLRNDRISKYNEWNFLIGGRKSVRKKLKEPSWVMTRIQKFWTKAIIL